MAAQEDGQATTTPRMAAVASASADAVSADAVSADAVSADAVPAGDAATADDPGATTHLPMLEAAETEMDAGGIVDEVDPEWAMADQPTLQIVPPPAVNRPTQRPAFLETGEQEVWPPRPTPPPRPASQPSTQSTPIGTAGPTSRPLNPIPRPVPRSYPTLGRLASPTGRPPQANVPAAYSDPRMRRLVELRLQRDAHSGGQRGPSDNAPVAQLVKQWWTDLMPGVQQALDHLHEARASGVYPIPAHEPTPATRMGDAFGRLTAAVRDLSGRAQAAAVPALTRLHERAEHAAQALVDRLEGSPIRQQAPFLGPGRLAVFFQQGVSVGQAQRLLVTNQARPMRLIPRRHGFLALVQPGREAVVGEQLRRHPYVRDVVYLEYDEKGQPLPPR